MKATAGRDTDLLTSGWC